MSNLFYFPDRYALQFLTWTLQHKGPMAVGQIKQHPFGKFLNKPLLKPFTAQFAKWDADLMPLFWPSQTPKLAEYELSLGQWGEAYSRWGRGWNQTSRHGFNLVLQVNFSWQHDASVSKLRKYWEPKYWNSYGHPIRKKGRPTLSWARIDIDWESGEALIEEIQSDWIMSLLYNLKDFRRKKGQPYRHCPEEKESLMRRLRCLEAYKNDIKTEVKYWPEITLFAAIELLYEQIGIKKIWYHTSESGAFVKRMGNHPGYNPPRSHYHDLPRRFGFQKVDAWPEFIRKQWGTRRKHIREQYDAVKWHYLEFE